jgi:hypothetical protein
MLQRMILLPPKPCFTHDTKAFAALLLWQTSSLHRNLNWMQQHQAVAEAAWLGRQLHAQPGFLHQGSSAVLHA